MNFSDVKIYINIRLGAFLFYRVSQSGDARFDKVKTNPTLFLTFWMVQGNKFSKTNCPVIIFNILIAAWIFTTLSPTLVQSKRQVPIGLRDYIGWGLFVTGFLIETIADLQKLRFRANPANSVSY